LPHAHGGPARLILPPRELIEATFPSDHELDPSLALFTAGQIQSMAAGGQPDVAGGLPPAFRLRYL